MLPFARILVMIPFVLHVAVTLAIAGALAVVGKFVGSHKALLLIRTARRKL
jgi:hypothetical protein